MMKVSEDMELQCKEVISLTGVEMRNTKVTPAQNLYQKHPQQQGPNSPKEETAQVSVSWWTRKHKLHSHSHDKILSIKKSALSTQPYMGHLYQPCPIRASPRLREGTPQKRRQSELKSQKMGVVVHETLPFLSWTRSRPTQKRANKTSPHSNRQN